MERLRAPLAALLCYILACPSMPMLLAQHRGPLDPDTGEAQVPAHITPRAPYKSIQLHGDERILHAMNRFTFGARPEDVEAVKEMGLDQWFDRQLHPAEIDESNLNARLAQFPAMQWTPEELELRLPSNAVIRQVADGKAPMPQAPLLKVIYSNEIARVEQRRQAKDAAVQPAPQAAPAAMSAPVVPADPQAPRYEMAPGAAPVSGPGGPGRAIAQMQAPPQANHATPLITLAATDPAPAEIPTDPAETARVLALAAPQRVTALVNMPQPQLDRFLKSLKGPQRQALTADLTPGQREVVGALENPQKLVVDELASQRLTRDIYSNAQLQEVMTDFWLNHFNVFLHKNEATPYYLVSFERDVIRPRALGKFEDLLQATAHSPAMMLYLDNATSMGPDSAAAQRNKMREARNPDAKKKAPEGLNENYARELMELHTLGVNGGYTQADVTQVARVLTGWTVDRPQRGGGFKFDESRHEPGEKKVLGVKIKENGELEGRQLLHMLAMNPATAQFLSRKLAIRFVGDEPPQPLVDRMAQSYLASGGDIATVIKTLYKSPEFWSVSDYRAKVKTPIEFVVSAMRASNADVTNFQPLINGLRDMGMPLYGAVPPTGYNWQAATWVSTGALVNRMNYSLQLASGRVPGIGIDWAAPPSLSIAGNASTLPDPAAEEQRLEALLVAGGVSDTTRAAVLQQFDAQCSENGIQPKLMAVANRPLKPAQAAAALGKEDQLLAGLLLGSPEFQRR